MLMRSVTSGTVATALGSGLTIFGAFFGMPAIVRVICGALDVGDGLGDGLADPDGVGDGVGVGVGVGDGEPLGDADGEADGLGVTSDNVTVHEKP